MGAFTFQRSLEWVVNDGLMAIFFFVVGMEIRSELHEGELSEWKRACLPVVAACGGMVAPALIYVALARGPGMRRGWGIPMATDIAFALGVLALLGKARALRVFASCFWLSPSWTISAPSSSSPSSIRPGSP